MEEVAEDDAITQLRVAQSSDSLSGANTMPPIKIMSTDSLNSLWHGAPASSPGAANPDGGDGTPRRNTRRRSSLGAAALNRRPSSLRHTMAKPRVHILDRDDLEQRALLTGTLKIHSSRAPARSSFSFLGAGVSKREEWKDRFVFLDRTLGLLVFNSKEAFELRDKKQMHIIFYRDIAKIERESDAGDQFTILFKNRALKAVGREAVHCIAMQGVEQCADFVEVLTERIQIVATVFTVGLNGEFPENAVCGVRPNVAVCFSGGGGRAHACASSQMRALHYLGLLNKQRCDYLSGVSAGAWATSIYIFYEDGANTDDELFGPLLSVSSQGVAADALANWTMHELQNQPLCPLLQPCVYNPVSVARELMFSVNPRELWERMVGKMFLRPFGLDEPHPFCLKQDLDTIRRNNPQLESIKFITPRTESRPFWMCHGAIVGPTWAKIGDMLPIQFTPLYVGSPYLHKIHYSSVDKKQQRRRRSSLLSKAKSADIWVGGGMVSPFVFGGEEPHSVLKPKRPHNLPAPARSTSTSTKSTSSSLFFRSQASKPEKSAEPQPQPPSQSKPEMTSVIFAQLMEEAIRQQDATSAPSLTSFAAPSKSHVASVQQHHHRRFDMRGRSVSTSRAISEARAAMEDLDLAPNMIERVFKYAQIALLGEKGSGPSAGGKPKTPASDGVYMKEVGLPFPERPFSLRHTLGITSDAPSVNLHDRAMFNRLNIQQNYWSPVYSTAGNTEGGRSKPGTTPGLKTVAKSELEVTRQVAMDMGDGGTLDNLGICAMLQRRVRRIVCFTNSTNCVPYPRPQQNGDASAMERAKRHLEHISTVRRTTAMEREGVEDLDRPPTYDEWVDDDILPLFGQDIDETALNYLGTHHSHNHVFPIEELRPLLRALQAKLVSGEPLVVRQTHRVLENAYWGIEGGWDVDVLWVYLDESSLFRDMLPADTREEMDRMSQGEFARFPNFKTFGNNKTISMDFSLSVRQLNLLSIYTEWQVMHNRDLFVEFIDAEAMPELHRQRRAPDATVNQLAQEGFC